MNAVNMVSSLYQAGIIQGALPGHSACPYIIAAGPRSGSTLLQRLLHSHSRAICMHELLLKTGGTSRFYRYNLGRRTRLIRLRDRDMGTFLDAILSEPQPPWIRAVGFKAMHVQPREDDERLLAWEKLGRIPNLHVLWLHRNPVRRVISFGIARKTGDWIGSKTKGQTRLDPQYLLRRLEIEERTAEEARSRVQECALLEVEFESLTENTRRVLGDIQKFLDLPVEELQASISRQNPKSIRDMVANFEEIKDAFCGTRWESSLREAVNRIPQEV